MIITALITKEMEQYIAVAFVDDTDFTLDRENCIEKMQYILDQYTKLYEATGRYVQYNKIRFWSWQQRRINGKLKIENKAAKITINDE